MRETQKGRRSWLERLTSPPEDEVETPEAEDPRSAPDSDAYPESDDPSPYQRPQRPWPGLPTADDEAWTDEPRGGPAERLSRTGPFAVGPTPASDRAAHSDRAAPGDPTGPDQAAPGDPTEDASTSDATIRLETMSITSATPASDMPDIDEMTASIFDKPTGTTGLTPGGDRTAGSLTGAPRHHRAPLDDDADSGEAEPSWGRGALSSQASPPYRAHDTEPDHRDRTTTPWPAPLEAGRPADDLDRNGATSGALGGGSHDPEARVIRADEPNGSGRGARSLPAGNSHSFATDEVDTVDTGPTEDERAEAARQQHADELQHRWLVTQAQLLDDPRDAVREAGLLINDALAHLTSTFSDHRDRIEQSWKDDDGLGTDQLREIMRRYRSLFQYVISVAKIPE